MILAWQVQRITVLTQNAKQLPALKDVLAPRAQSVADMVGMLHRMGAQIGRAVTITSSPEGSVA